MKAINELYFGNISAYDLAMPKTWHDIKNRLIEVDDKLEGTLTQEQNELLEKQRYLTCEMTSIERLSSFEYGISVGISLASESNTCLNKIHHRD